MLNWWLSLPSLRRCRSDKADQDPKEESTSGPLPSRVIRATRGRQKRSSASYNAAVAEQGKTIDDPQLDNDEKEAHGEFESEHPGYCGAQDTFYVGNLKGVGRVYQQTFIDTYAKVSCAKLYDRKTPITAADLLNDRVISTVTRLGCYAC